MIRNFFSTPNVIGRLVIVLFFAGGVVFAGAFDGFVIETEASSCCGGGMDAALFSSSGNNGGGGGGGGGGDDDCDCLEHAGTSCSSCDEGPKCAGTTTDVCKPSDCNPGKGGCTCDGIICKKADKSCKVKCT